MMCDVVEIATQVAIGLRKSVADIGVRQMADFINAMSLVGVLVDKNFLEEEASPSFIDKFQANFKRLTEEMAKPEFADARSRMAAHKFGVIEHSVEDMLIASATAMQETVQTIASDFSLSKEKTLEMVVAIIAFGIISVTPDDRMAFVLEGMFENIVEKLRVWDQIIPPDSELFEGF